MKTLSNNRGVALIVLIVAMTLIAILGASFVSLMSSKQKGFLYQIDSYRALNLANAGVEYAIRYTGDKITPNPNLNDFFHDLTTCPNVPVVSSQPDTANLATAQWKRFDFGNGRFYISYYLNPSDPDEINNNKILYSVGVVGGTQRVVKLKNFLIYATPASSYGLDKLNLVPNQKPYIFGTYIVVPILNLTTSSVEISSIQLEADLDDGQPKQFTDIYIRNANVYGGINIYHYLPGSYSSNCSGYPPPATELPCGWGGFIAIPDGGPMTSLLNVSATIPPSSIRWISLRFNEFNSGLNGTYTITFNFAGGSSTIQFYVSYP